MQRCVISKDSGHMSYWRAILSSQILKLKHFTPVADPGLQIGGGGGHPDPEVREGGPVRVSALSLI